MAEIVGNDGVSQKKSCKDLHSLAAYLKRNNNWVEVHV
jgi:hypothetical protein